MMTTENTTLTRRRARKYVLTIRNEIPNNKAEVQLPANDWTPVDQLKQQACAQFGVKAREARLMYKNRELRGGNVESYHLKLNSLLLLFVCPQFEQTKGYLQEQKLLEDYPISKYTGDLEQVLKQVRLAMYKDIKPKISMEQGTSGTYFLESVERKRIGVFKPFDEEYNAPSNPHGFAYQNKLGSRTDRSGIISGEMAAREVAAFLLDHYYGGVHRVPSTTWIYFYHPSFVFYDTQPESPARHFAKGLGSSESKKTSLEGSLESTNASSLAIQRTENNAPYLRPKQGSFQVYLQHDDFFENIGWSSFTPDDLHRIGLLDVRILNKDRNSENILARRIERARYELFPIDHGYSLADDLYILEEWIVWMGCPHSKKPFSPELLNFVRSIDPVEDCRRIQQSLQIREECLLNLRIAEEFLKHAVAAGLTLYDIGRMLYRYDEDVKSKLEQIIEFARYLYKQKKKIEQKNNADFQQQLKITLTGKQQLQQLQQQQLNKVQQLFSPAEKENGLHQNEEVEEEEDEEEEEEEEEEQKTFEQNFTNFVSHELGLLTSQHIGGGLAPVQEVEENHNDGGEAKLRQLLRCVSAPDLRELENGGGSSKRLRNFKNRHRRMRVLEKYVNKCDLASYSKSNSAQKGQANNGEFDAFADTHAQEEEEDECDEEAKLPQGDSLDSTALQLTKKVCSENSNGKKKLKVQEQLGSSEESPLLNAKQLSLQAQLSHNENEYDDDEFKIRWDNNLFFDCFEFILAFSLRKVVEQKKADEQRTAEQPRRKRIESVEIHNYK